MFNLFKKKIPPEPKVERMVIVDLWYYDELYPNILQSWTWQTVDDAPNFPRAMEWISSMSEVVTIKHWHIREFDRPVPNYDPGVVSDFHPHFN